jgi:hypothetical protein
MIKYEIYNESKLNKGASVSGHSKWSTIKRQKGVADAKRGAVFTKIGNAIAIAARGGLDPTMNSALALAIEKAKSANMPAANIQRAIDRVADKSAAALEEVVYEGNGIEANHPVMAARQLTEGQQVVLHEHPIPRLVHVKGAHAGHAHPGMVRPSLAVLHAINPGLAFALHCLGDFHVVNQHGTTIQSSASMSVCEASQPMSISPVAVFMVIDGRTVAAPPFSRANCAL